MELVGWIASRR